MIKITLTSGSRTLSRTFFQESVQLGCDEKADFQLPFSLGAGEFLTIREEGGQFLLSGAAGNRPIEAGETIELGEWHLLFEGVAEKGAQPSTTCEIDRELAELEAFIDRKPNEREVSKWLEEPRRRRRWPLAAALVVLLVLLLGSFKVAGRQEERRAAESLVQIGVALQEGAQSGAEPQVSRAYLSTQLAKLAERGIKTETAIELKRTIRDAHYSLKLYTSSDPERFLLVAAPVDDAPWRLFLRKPTLVLSSEEMAIRRSSDHAPWRELLGWSFSLDKADPHRLHSLLQSAEPILFAQ